MWSNARVTDFETTKTCLKPSQLTN